MQEEIQILKEYQFHWNLSRSWEKLEKTAIFFDKTFLDGPPEQMINFSGVCRLLIQKGGNVGCVFAPYVSFAKKAPQKNTIGC